MLAGHAPSFRPAGDASMRWTADYDEAAALYRTCRDEGETVRKLIDCLIGSMYRSADKFHAPNCQRW